MNETINLLMKHRTIRKFTKDKIRDEDLKMMLEASNRAPSANGLQKYSIIHVTDKNIKDKLSQIGKQSYMKDATELFIFIADLFRNAQIAKEKGENESLFTSFEMLFQSIGDCYIACQNLVVAAESLGYGTNYFGNIFNDIDKVIEILKLPKLTFPVIALGIGIIDQNPQVKPRMNLENKVFDNSYKIYDDYLETFKEYDNIMQTYYDLRDANRRVDSDTNQVITQAKKSFIERKDILKSIEKQGFILSK